MLPQDLPPQDLPPQGWGAETDDAGHVYSVDPAMANEVEEGGAARQLEEPARLPAATAEPEATTGSSQHEILQQQKPTKRKKTVGGGGGLCCGSRPKRPKDASSLSSDVSDTVPSPPTAISYHATEAEHPLPDGWSTQISRSTGRIYYVNDLTMETSYDRPTVPAAEWASERLEEEVDADWEAADPEPGAAPESDDEVDDSNEVGAVPMRWTADHAGPAPDTKGKEEMEGATEEQDEVEEQRVTETETAEEEEEGGDWVELTATELARARSSEAADEIAATGGQVSPAAVSEPCSDASAYKHDWSFCLPYSRYCVF